MRIQAITEKKRKYDLQIHSGFSIGSVHVNVGVEQSI